MFKALIAASMALTLILGAAGTVHAAQDGGNFTKVVEMWRYQTRLNTQNTDPVMDPTQDQIRDQLQDQTQDQLREQDRLHLTDQADPLHLNSNNPWTDEAPVPNSGYGPGDGTCTDCSPNAEPGPHGNGNGNKP